MTRYRSPSPGYNRAREDGYHDSHTIDEYKESPPSRTSDHDRDDCSRPRKDRGTGGYGEDDLKEKK